MVLHNKYDKATLRRKLEAENFKRITVSFYRYVKIEDTALFRDKMYKDFSELSILGRIYVANEGINAQISVPEPHWDTFKIYLNSSAELKEMPLKIAVEDDGKSFLKLIVRIRHKIVADGIDDPNFDASKVGKHLEAIEFHEKLNDPNVVVIDMRNHYESEVGHFENAILPDVDTFRESLPKIAADMEAYKNKEILLYCTGGVRCEKASAYFKYKGYENVYQLHGGIIEYARKVKEYGLKSKFIGKNFVFDERLGERITNDIIAKCHQCDNSCDHHTNCANEDCHLLFIQCDTCKTKYEGCCSDACKSIIQLSIDEQKQRRRGKIKHHAHAVYKSRLRPNLKEMYLHPDAFSLSKI
jgi:UPF0176 protein